MKRINLLLILSILTFIFASSNQEANGVLSLKKQLLAKQLEYNEQNNITPVSIKKNIQEIIENTAEQDHVTVDIENTK